MPGWCAPGGPVACDEAQYAALACLLAMIYHCRRPASLGAEDREGEAMPRELIAVAPRTPRLVDYEPPPLGPDMVRLLSEFGAPKHGTELMAYRRAATDVGTRYDPEWRCFLPREDGGRGRFPLRLGNTIVGRIEAAGPEVSGLRPGGPGVRPPPAARGARGNHGAHAAPAARPDARGGAVRRPGRRGPGDARRPGSPGRPGGGVRDGRHRPLGHSTAGSPGPPWSSRSTPCPCAGTWRRAWGRTWCLIRARGTRGWRSGA